MESGEPLQLLDPKGKPRLPLPTGTLDGEALLRGYRAMVLTRLYDARAINLQRTGQLGTYPSSLGQEAASVGLALPMTDDDVLIPSYREHGALLVRGVTLTEQLLYWGGDERGSDFAKPRQDLPFAVPIATQTLHAAGVAAALQHLGKPGVAVACCGDGATSKGDFYEALNLAGVWRLPLVMVVINNQWAISVPRSAQTAVASLADKARAAGVPGLVADGNDLLAVHQVVSRAIAHARAGKGATLVELVTYRLGDHTTADDAHRYRDDDEVSRHWQLDPLPRLRNYLADRGLWDKQREEALLQELGEALQGAVDRYLATPAQPATAMFDYLYAELPGSLRAQRQMVAPGAPQAVESNHE